MDSRSYIPEVCPFCTAPYRDPKVLPCFHILCRECARGLVVHGRKQVLCPVERCRKEFVIVNNDPESLPDALPVYYNRDLRSLKNKVETDKEYCRNCLQSKRITCNAVAVCKVCDFICKNCKEEHSSNKSRYADHECITFLELSNSDTDNMHHGILKRQRTRSFTQKARCADASHFKEPVRCYCLDCSEFVCSLCEEQTHSGHRLKELSEAARHCKQSLMDKLPNIRVVHKRVAGAAHDVRTAKSAVSDQKVVLMSSIEHAFSRLAKILERRKQEMISRLTAVTNQKTTKLREQHDELDRLSGEFERIEDYVHSTIHMSTDYELLHSYKFIEKEAHNSLQKGSKLPVQPVEVANMALKNSGESHLRELCSKHLNIFVEQANASSCSAEGSGLKTAETEKYAHFTVKVVDKNNKRCTNSQHVTAKLKCIENDFVSSTEMVESSPNKYEASYCPQFRGEHELTVLVNGNPIPGSPFLVNVTKPLLELGQSQGVIYDVTGPRGIALNKAGNLLVCEWNGHKIVELDKIGRQVQEIGGGEVHHPASIATATDGSIYITDAAGEKCCLVKYSSEGKLLKRIGQNGKKIGEFANPRGVCIRANMDVWVCDRDNHRVQIFDTNLVFQHNLDLSQVDSNLQQKPKPNDITFDETGNFYITDFANHCILCFSASGEYQWNFSGDHNKKLVLHGPECITIDSAGFLFVTESGNHRVSIFKRTGELIKTFGGLGKNEGELKFPMGIIVDKNGSVFVAELLNNRIQMF